MNRPLPKPNAESAHFWKGCAQGELRYQVCAACNRTQFPPRMHCAHCHSIRLAWRVSAGLGTVHTHTTVFRAPSPAFRADVPYVIALIDLDEGFRLMVNMADFQPDEVAIGLRVRIGFRQAGEGIHLPEARRPETGLHGRTAR